MERTEGIGRRGERLDEADVPQYLKDEKRRDRKETGVGFESNVNAKGERAERLFPISRTSRRFPSV